MRRPRRRRTLSAWLAPRALLVTLFLVACADLFDDPIQCKSNDDCARFSAVCELGQGICVVQSDVGSSGDPTPPVPAKPPDATADGPLDPARCNVSPKETETIGTKTGALPGDAGQRAEVNGDVRLGCDKDWLLDALVFVESGSTLTIDPGTTIRAKKGVGAGLVIATSARLVAAGTKDLPIVITSASTTPLAGDWRGLFLMGRAPPNGIGPFAGDAIFPFSGTNAADDSGVLTFMRIEYAKSGLIFAGVGRGTKVDSIEVRQTRDNCFTFDGGTVDAKHLVCQSPGDDQFEWIEGYAGRAQFLFGQKTPLNPPFQANGMLVDSAHPVVYNATICGDSPTPPSGYGVQFRDNATLDVHASIVSGWFGGVDATGNLPTPGTIRRSIFFGNGVNPAFDEIPTEPDPVSPLFDDDNGFDENVWFATGSRLNAVTDPALLGCFDAKVPKPWPQTAITTNAIAPPKDAFFDANALYIGAFKDATDPWMSGAWVRFSDK